MVSPTAFAEARLRAVRLARRTSLGLGGEPDLLFEPASEAEVADVLGSCRDAGVPVRVLGGGTNLLVTDRRVAGAVLTTRNLRWVDVHETAVDVGAGLPFQTLVRGAVGWGLPGLAGCAGIPGTTGGAVTMNAGGRYGEVADALVEVAGFELDGARFVRRIEPRDLGYRESVFEGRLVTSARFRRLPSHDPACAERLYREAMQAKQTQQPCGVRTAGCMFRNPPRGPSAGRLIDEAGLKGHRVGGAVVSTLHANFVESRDGATARDVHRLLDVVRDAVEGRFGVRLRLEVRVWD